MFQVFCGNWKGSAVPVSPQAVVGAADDERAVPVEVDGTHGVGVGGERLQAAPRLDVPHPHALVELKQEPRQVTISQQQFYIGCPRSYFFGLSGPTILYSTVKCERL